MHSNPYILQEISRRSFQLNKYDEASLSWRHSILTVRTHKGVHFYEFSYNLQCTDKKIDFIESSIPTKKSSPATSLFSSDFIRYGLTNMQLTQMVIDPAFWPYNPHLVEEMTAVVAFEWSPINLLYNGRPILAIINNIGNVDLYQSQNGSWVNFLDLSVCVLEYFNVPEPKNLEELKESVLLLESCAICWAPKANEDGSCFFITVQKNGKILLWYLNETEGELKADFFGSIESDSSEIVSLLWVEKLNNKFVLIISNIEGQIIALDCKIEDSIKLVKRTILWSCKDKMVAHYLQYTMIDNRIILLCNKHRHLLALMLDENCNVVSQYINNVNDHKITIISNSTSGCFLGTMNIKIYKINVIVLNNELDVRLDLIDMKDSYPNCELHGLNFSDNGALCAMALIDRRLCYRKEAPKVDMILLTKDANEITEISLLLNSSLKEIIKLWDIIELLRCKMMKLKIMPIVDLKQLVEDGNTDIYKLKVYWIVATIWSNLEKNFIVYKGLLPVSIEAVKDKIMFSHAQSQIYSIYNKLKNTGDLSDFEKQTFVGTRLFLEFYCTKYEKELNEIVPTDILNIIAKNPYICQCCDDYLEGLKCTKGHLNMFCSVTFTPIETDDYLVCKRCGVTAREELYANKVKCIFCDKCLHNYYATS